MGYYIGAIFIVDTAVLVLSEFGGRNYFAPVGFLPC